MSNRQTGDVSIDVEGQPYRLVLDINALCELESMLSTADRTVTFHEAMAKAGTGSLRHIRAAFWAALRRHHGHMTLSDVGVWIEAAGLDKLNAQLGELAQSAGPDPKDATELGVKPAKGRPPKAQAAGTGGRLNSTPGAPA